MTWSQKSKEEKGNHIHALYKIFDRPDAPLCACGHHGMEDHYHCNQMACIRCECPGLREKTMFKLICLPEGDLGKTDIEAFDTEAERTAFARGFREGAGNYGAGCTYLIEWEKLADPDAFEEEFGDDVRDSCPGTLLYDVNALRVLVGWKDSE